MIRLNAFLNKQTGFPTAGGHSPYWLRLETTHVKRDGRLNLIQKYQMRFLAVSHLRPWYMPTKTVEIPQWIDPLQAEEGPLRLFRPISHERDGNFPILAPANHAGLWLPEAAYQALTAELNRLAKRLEYGRALINLEYDVTMAALKKSNGEQE